MKKLTMLAILLSSGIALAQNEGVSNPPPGPEPEAIPPTPKNREKARLGADVAGEPGEHAEEEELDPSKHFNFFNFSYHGKDELDGPFGDGVMVDKETGAVIKEEEPMSAPFALMLLNFGVFVFILGKYGTPAARKIAKDRHDQIKNALDEAAKLREQAQKKLTELEGRIKGVDAEIKTIVDDIRASAEGDKQRILETARAQAEAMKKDAELRIAAEIEMARAQLTKEVTAAAAAATEQLLREKMTGDDQNRLVSTFISNVQRGAAQERR